VATLNLDYFNPEHETLAILGKGNRFRLIELEPKTTQLLQLYIDRFRPSPKPPYQHRLFVNQRGEELTRFGIYRLCRKYLVMALPPKRLKSINPAQSFRHYAELLTMPSDDSFLINKDGLAIINSA
jgi:integrase/recombinase XerD